MSARRLPQGGEIDRSQHWRFCFDGKTYEGHPGDTLASALLANGVRLVGRSFKYHRPRGILSAGPEEPNALVELREGARREPNSKATEIELYDGLTCRSQNRWPSLAFDVRALHGWAGPVISAGFYYKTFMWPQKFWERVYEPLIRRAAGLGRAAKAPDPDHYEALHTHCDVLVVGAGAAGLAAARAAAGSGARVVLCEQDFIAGAGLLLADDPAWHTWRQDTLVALAAEPELELLTRTNVFGYYDHNLLGAVERVGDHLHESQLAPQGGVRQRYCTIRAKQVVLATGASERLIAFPGNDRPGVMLAGSVLTYLRRFGVLPGARAVLFTNNDSAYETARALLAAGVPVVLVDSRGDHPQAGALRAQGADVRLEAEVIGFKGAQVHLRQRASGETCRVAADLLCVSGGWNPNVQLASQSGAPIRWDDALATYLPGAPVQAERSAGAARGLFDWAQSVADGWAAGCEAARAAGFTPAASPPWDALPVAQTPATPLVPLWEVAAPGRAAGKSFADLQHDVTAEDIRLAHREGYSHIEHAKRYTTHNMATDQGKTGGLVGAAILAQARGVPVEAVGLPSYRPYTQPVSFGAIAAHATADTMQPIRRSALHAWHVAHGALMQPAGGDWVRPFYYPQASESPWQAILREARAVRTGVGLCDVSTLGKIDIQGPDAARFLDRIYANRFSTLPVGRCRYGLMLREDGIVLDDGTTTRLAEQHYVMTTGTAQAGPVLEHLEYHAQVVWAELDVQFCSVTDQWAQLALAGPKSRATLAAVLEGLDIANEAFPFMAAGAGTVAGVPVRVFRISFSGELAFEVAMPSGYAQAVWEALLAAGAAHGITPYGLEALNLLRIEKGHAAGAELNGWTTAADLGLARMLKKPGEKFTDAESDYIGRVLQQRPALADPARPRLVGIAALDPAHRLLGGAHIVAAPGGQSLGWVSSVTQSVEKPGWIGLAFVANGAERLGEELYADSPLHRECVAVRLVNPVQLDPEGHRVRA